MPDKPKPDGHPEPAPPQYREGAAAAGQWAAGYDSEEAARLENPAQAAVAEHEQAPGSAVEEISFDDEEGGDEEKKRLNQVVEIKDAGPCRKHIKITIPRADIDERINEKFSKLVTDSFVPGYRPGKAPRKLIEKKFYSDVADQLKAELLLQSLEQLADEQKINPIAQPNLDPYKVELPKEGDLNYEFEIEVAPEFDLPQYKNLKLKRPTREIKEEEVSKAEKRYLSRFGTLVPKDGPAELDDFVSVDVEVAVPGKEPTKLPDMLVRLEPQLSFKDGVIRDFGDKLKGVKPGESRKVEIALTSNASDVDLRGQSVPATFRVHEVKQLRLPELDEQFLDKLGLNTPEQLHEKVRIAIQSQLQYEQRESARQQVLSHIAAAADWELPRDLLLRQGRKTLQRKLMEMQSAGLSEHEVRSRYQVLQQDAMATTARSLKEHFVLQKIAEVEDIKVEDDDIEYEIETISAQTEETPRRVRARLEKDQLMETLMTQILERKALDAILESAEYQDVPMDAAAPASEIVEQQAVPGQAPEEKEAAEAEKQMQAAVGGA